MRFEKKYVFINKSQETEEYGGGSISFYLYQHAGQSCRPSHD